jgi:hypothetical protein
MAKAEKNAEQNAQTEELDEEAIRLRAYQISQGEDAGSPDENWERAVSELSADLSREEPS